MPTVERRRSMRCSVQRERSPVFQIARSKRGKPSVCVTRPGEVSPTEYEFDSEDEARAWVERCRKLGRFSCHSEHPTRQYLETD
jgi:hypothetical protein